MILRLSSMLVSAGARELALGDLSRHHDWLNKYEQ